MSDRPESAQEILDEMARSFGDCNINILIKDLEYLAMKEKQYEAKAAEKAKADKLALLSEIKIIVSAEYIPPPEGFVNETVKENNETVDVMLADIEAIKQRIEADK